MMQSSTIWNSAFREIGARFAGTKASGTRCATCDATPTLNRRVDVRRCSNVSARFRHQLNRTNDYAVSHRVSVRAHGSLSPKFGKIPRERRGDATTRRARRLSNGGEFGANFKRLAVARAATRSSEFPTTILARPASHSRRSIRHDDHPLFDSAPSVFYSWPHVTFRR